MILFPAIDIQQGKVVRLKQGKFDQVTEYSHDPAETAQRWEREGAQWLHVVDLDGAKNGRVTNWDALEKIARSVKIPIEVGGGIRTEDDVKHLLSIGMQRVIFGTRAITDPLALKTMIHQWPEHIAVSIDASNGMVTKLGWTEQTNTDAVSFAKQLEHDGLRCLIYTDIARDGMLTGPNIEALRHVLRAVSVDVIASGGISNIDDIKALLELESEGLYGAITGRALYEGTLDLREALALC